MKLKYIILPVFFLVSLLSNISMGMFINVDNVQNKSKEILDKYFTKLMDYELYNSTGYNDTLQEIGDYINTRYLSSNYNKTAFIIKNGKYLLDIKKIQYMDYEPNLFGYSQIDLDKEFSKYMYYHNYDLGQVLGTGSLGKQYLLYLTNLVEKYPNTISCDNKINIGSLLYLLMLTSKDKSILDVNNFETIQSMLLCYIKNNKDKYIYDYKLPTWSKPYRIHNITKGLEIISGWWDKGEIKRIGQELLDADKEHNLYVDGYIIQTVKNSSGVNELVDDKKAYAGGLCGVSTVVYQSILPIAGIDILQRRPHSIWYYGLYGNKVGQDATIVWGYNNKARLDLVIQNNTNQDIYLKGYAYKQNKKFITGIKLITFKPLEKRQVMYLGRKGNCGYNKIGGEIIVSCYRDIK